MHFSVKSKITEILRGVQIYGTSLKLKNGLMDFNEIWYQQYTGSFRFCATFNFKVLKAVRVLGGGSIFFIFCATNDAHIEMY